MRNNLEDAWKSPNPHDLRDYLDNTETKEIRMDLTNMLRRYADISFLRIIRAELDDFIEGRDKYESASDQATD